MFHYTPADAARRNELNMTREERILELVALLMEKGNSQEDAIEMTEKLQCHVDAEGRPIKPGEASTLCANDEALKRARAFVKAVMQLYASGVVTTNRNIAA